MVPMAIVDQLLSSWTKEHFLDEEVLDAAGRAKLQDVLGRFQSSLDAEADWDTVPWTALVDLL